MEALIAGFKFALAAFKHGAVAQGDLLVREKALVDAVLAVIPAEITHTTSGFVVAEASIRYGHCPREAAC